MNISRWLGRAVIGCVAATAVVTYAQAPVTVDRGVLPRGTVWEIRMPTNWNGVLISDLDAATPPTAALQALIPALVSRGFAVSGTGRRADRQANYDSAREIDDLINVIDIVEAKYGKPKRTIYHGISGGGNVALLFAETRPDRIDGAVSSCAHTPQWMMNNGLDAWFVLKALIAPNLDIVNLAGVDLQALTAAWRQAITQAQQTPLGRARIALATTIGRWPAWISSTTPEPDPSNVEALQHSMFESLLMQSPGGSARVMFENAGRGQLSFNTDIDYSEVFLKGGDENHKHAVRELYRRAGADLADDLDAVNAFPRVSASPQAMKFWAAPGHTVTAEPKVPVLRIHTNGDGSVPISLVQGYDEAVRERGFGDLYRQAFVNAPGHCTFTTGETLAAIETVMQRLDLGDWPSTSPSALNSLAKALDPSSAARYYNYRPFEYGREWFPELRDYTGGFGLKAASGQ